MARKLATAVFTLGCMHTSVVAALGLGELRLESFLNEPLAATVDLLNTGDLHEDQIRVRLATSEDFEKLGVDRAYFLTSIKFKISIDAQGRGQIVLTSDDPVLEPYLDFLIEARWPNGRLLREYTVLVDPPAFDTQAPIVSAQERVAEIDGVESTVAKKKTVDASTGTQVSTRQSDLARGAMPQRNFGSDASQAALAGDRYMIRRDETLWSIAQRARPEGVSVHQTMLDIQRLNPDAFINGNINLIKAGYIINLPSSNEISSDDFESAREEVQQQNKAWRDGVTRPSGPSLRISDDKVELDKKQSDSSQGVAATPVTSTAAAESADEMALEREDMTGRVAAMEEQVETLQRILSLKDDQIAALQAALADAEAGSPEADEAQAALDQAVDTASLILEGEEETDAADGEPPAVREVALETETKAVEPEPEKPKLVVTTPQKSAAPSEQEGGFMTYILGLLALIGLGGAVVWWRRRNSDEDTTDFVDETEDDTPVARVEAVAKPTAAKAEPAPEPEPEPEAEPVAPAETQAETSKRVNRGYGEGKHDQYASDDTGDALAEADIYIAYGRYPQAVELLKTALENESSNSMYHLKLVELYTQMGESTLAHKQFATLQSLGDDSAIARADDILRTAGASESAAPEAVSSPVENSSPGAATFTIDDPVDLESEFGELEIETSDGDVLGDDLDLSSDFGDDIDSQEDDGDDLVFAEGGNEMSTKMDLARAYLDMGDDEGARQILEEVVLEGSPEQKDEARALIDRIG